MAGLGAFPAYRRAAVEALVHCFTYPALLALCSRFWRFCKGEQIHAKFLFTFSLRRLALLCIEQLVAAFGVQPALAPVVIVLVAHVAAAHPPVTLFLVLGGMDVAKAHEA